MKLIAKAKPIHIRIKSGGEEHSSLDSLRNNLCVQDLMPLINDRRLSRWLRQQGEERLADAVDELMSGRISDDYLLYFDDELYFKVLRLFFEKEFEMSSATDVYSLYGYWRENNLHAKSLASIRNNLLDSYSGFKFLLEKYRDDITDEMLFSKLQSFEHYNDPQLLYLQGKMLYDCRVKEANSLDKAYELIKKSADLGWAEALDLLKGGNFIFTHRKAILTPRAEAKIKRQIERWKTDRLGYINNIVSTDEEIVKQVKVLLREFRDILSECSNSGWGMKATYQYVNTIYKHLSPDDRFYRERRFVEDLVKWYNNKKCLNQGLFQELATKYQYPLAQYMMHSTELEKTLARFVFLSDPYGPVDADDSYFKIGKRQFSKGLFSEQLAFILDHLFVF